MHGDLFVPLHWSRHQGPGRDTQNTRTSTGTGTGAGTDMETHTHAHTLPNDRALLLSVVSLLLPASASRATHLLAGSSKVDEGSCE